MSTDLLWPRHSTPGDLEAIESTPSVERLGRYALFWDIKERS